jgi:hypothetical protein
MENQSNNKHSKEKKTNSSKIERLALALKANIKRRKKQEKIKDEK